MAYYDAPSDEIFEEIRKASIEIWETYNDTYGYATEKIDMVKSLTNFKDNWGTMVGMFDSNNQARLLAKLSVEAKLKVAEWLQLGNYGRYV
jgi:malate/lactate dehydrogenase